MKNIFPWKFTPTEEDFNDLWKNATFVFDTNFLLDLYRVSRRTSEDFLKILEHLKERIWLPNQVVGEFLDRKDGIIDSEIASLERSIGILEKWEQEQTSFSSLKISLRESGRLIGSEVESLFSEKSKSYERSISSTRKRIQKRLLELFETHSPIKKASDDIIEHLITLFDGKIGESYDEDKLQKLYKLGETRYAKKIPPGFEDEKEKDDIKKFGDFILWKQILDYAKDKSTQIILITGERKQDWWVKKDGQIQSPHLLLRKEFFLETQKQFWLYSTRRFLELARSNLNVFVSENSINESKSVSEYSEIQAIKSEREPYEIVSPVQAILNLNRYYSVIDSINSVKLPSIDFSKILGMPTFQITEILENITRSQRQMELISSYVSSDAFKNKYIEQNEALTKAISEVTRLAQVENNRQADLLARYFTRTIVNSSEKGEDSSDDSSTS
jgi:hypothetical protein